MLNYGAEGSPGGSDWSEQSEQSETEFDNSDDEIDYKEPGMSWCAETEREEPVQGKNCRHINPRDTKMYMVMYAKPGKRGIPSNVVRCSGQSRTLLKCYSKTRYER